MSAITQSRTLAVKIPTEQVVLNGELVIPDQAHGIVLVANGTGSSGLCSRNRRIAADLNEVGFATLLFDLRSTAERQRLNGPQDIEHLAERLLAATEWVGLDHDIGDLPQGYFAAGLGAAVALVAAARAGHKVHAIVSLGGRPDLAFHWLSEVLAPTLLLVGSDDQLVSQLNLEAQQHLHVPSRLGLVPRPEHSFDEPEVAREVSSRTREWFEEHLAVGGLVG